MDKRGSGNTSVRPITEWFPVDRRRGESAENQDREGDRSEMPSDEFSELVASCIKTEIEEYDDDHKPVGGPPSKRERRLQEDDDAFSEEVANSVKLDTEDVANSVKVDTEDVANSIKVDDQPAMCLWIRRKWEMPAKVTTPAEVKFSALVAGSKQKDKVEDKPREPSPEFDPRRYTSRCYDLAQEILGFRIKSSNRRETKRGKVRTTMELAFGADEAPLLLYLALESDSADLVDAKLVKYFFNDEESVAEVAQPLGHLFKEGNCRSLVAGVATFVALRDRRRELLERLRARYGPLVTVETTEGGHCTVEARDAQRSYFLAEWRVALRRCTGRFDNAFVFSGISENPPLVVASQEFDYLISEEELGAEELERRWDNIMREVQELSERGA